MIKSVLIPVAIIFLAAGSIYYFARIWKES